MSTPRGSRAATRGSPIGRRCHARRSLRSPTGAVRIPLNISDGGATGVSRFIDAFGGAGYQQIALSTDDIFDFVATVRGRGAAFLPIPDNYYDDLGARLNLYEAL